MTIPKNMPDYLWAQHDPSDKNRSIIYIRNLVAIFNLPVSKNKRVMTYWPAGAPDSLESEAWDWICQKALKEHLDSLGGTQSPTMYQFEPQPNEPPRIFAVENEESDFYGVMVVRPHISLWQEIECDDGATNLVEVMCNKSFKDKYDNDQDAYQRMVRETAEWYQNFIQQEEGNLSV